MDSLHDIRSLPPERLREVERLCRSLARELVAQSSDCEDLVQEAWTAALASPPKRSWSLERWFAGTLRNLANQRRRANLRRRKHESAGGETLAGFHESSELEKFDEICRLMNRINRLESRAREVLLLRYWKGLSLKQIAQRLDIPLGSAKTLIYRAIGKLREDLDQSEDRHRLWSSCVALISYPSVEKATPFTICGGVLMTKKSVGLASIVVVLFVGGGLLLGPGRDRGAGDAESAAVAMPTTRSMELESEDSTRQPVEAQEQSDAAVARDATATCVVAGRIVGARSDVPWSSGVQIRPVREAAKRLEPKVDSSDVIVASVDDRGNFHAAVQRLFEGGPKVLYLEVATEDPMYIGDPVRITLPASSVLESESTKHEVEIPVELCGALKGVILDERGQSIGGMSVSFEGANRASVHCRCDAKGRFRLKSNQAGSGFVLASNNTRTEPWLQAVARAELVLGEEWEVDPLVMTDGEAIEGTITVGGFPANGIRTVAKWTGAGRIGEHVLELAGVPGGTSLFCDSGMAFSDEQGSFRINGLWPGPYELTVGGFGIVQTSKKFVKSVHDVMAPDRIDVGLDAVHVTFDLDADWTPRLTIEETVDGKLRKWGLNGGGRSSWFLENTTRSSRRPMAMSLPESSSRHRPTRHGNV